MRRGCLILQPFLIVVEYNEYNIRLPWTIRQTYFSKPRKFPRHIIRFHFECDNIIHCGQNRTSFIYLINNGDTSQPCVFFLKPNVKIEYSFRMFTAEPSTLNFNLKLQIKRASLHSNLVFITSFIEIYLYMHLCLSCCVCYDLRQWHLFY